MAAQAREQGRYLGGLPPYGYRLADVGPHPNREHASWGRRAHRLEPDPQAAPVVRWIFAQRLAGHSMARVTRALNEAGIPCPSAADPDRNAHRTGERWSLTTVRAILANPRYTGSVKASRRGLVLMRAQDPAHVLGQASLIGDRRGGEQGIQGRAVEAFASVRAGGHDEERRPAGLVLQAGQRRRAALGTHPAAKNNRVVPGLTQQAGELFQMAGPVG